MLNFACVALDAMMQYLEDGTFRASVLGRGSGGCAVRRLDYCCVVLEHAWCIAFRMRGAPTPVRMVPRLAYAWCKGRWTAVHRNAALRCSDEKCMLAR